MFTEKSNSQKSRFCDAFVFRLPMSLFRALRPVATASVRRNLAVSAQLNSAAPAAPLRRDDVMAAWVEYFDHPDCDYYNYRLGAQHLFSDDLLFDPVVYQVTETLILSVLIIFSFRLCSTLAGDSTTSRLRCARSSSSDSSAATAKTSTTGSCKN